MSAISPQMRLQMLPGNSSQSDAPSPPFDLARRGRRFLPPLIHLNHHHCVHVHFDPRKPVPARLRTQVTVAQPKPVPARLGTQVTVAQPKPVPAHLRTHVIVAQPAPAPLVTRGTVIEPTRHPANPQPTPTVAPHHHRHQPTRAESPVTPSSTHSRHRPSHHATVPNHRNYAEFTDPLAPGVLEDDHTLEVFTLIKNLGRRAKTS
jgi:hypothetical protein